MRRRRALPDRGGGTVNSTGSPRPGRRDPSTISTPPGGSENRSSPVGRARSQSPHRRSTHSRPGIARILSASSPARHGKEIGRYFMPRSSLIRVTVGGGCHDDRVGREVGKTADVGWQIGISKSLPYPLGAVWAFLSSKEGV